MNKTISLSDSDSSGTLRIIFGFLALGPTAYSLLVLRNQILTGVDPFGASFGSGAATVAIICWYFVLRGHVAESRVRLLYAAIGGCVLGGIGFAVGFFGPVILDPSANQGPLLGIFITGPVGYMIGAAIGWLYACFRKR